MCKECGRLAYRPIPSPYLLRSYWDGGDEATLIGGMIVSTPEFAVSIKKKIASAQFMIETRDVEETPQDDLPADYSEMIGEIRCRGWLK